MSLGLTGVQIGVDVAIIFVAGAFFYGWIKDKKEEKEKEKEKDIQLIFNKIGDFNELINDLYKAVSKEKEVVSEENITILNLVPPMLLEELTKLQLIILSNNASDDLYKKVKELTEVMEKAIKDTGNPGLCLYIAALTLGELLLHIKSQETVDLYMKDRFGNDINGLKQKIEEHLSKKDVK